MDAPLSSPTRQQAQRTALQWPQPTTNNNNNKGFGAVPPPQQQHQQQQQQHHHHASSVQQANPSTDALLKDFSLVAEAAKRAQMAVVMRDLGDLGLS